MSCGGPSTRILPPTMTMIFEAKRNTTSMSCSMKRMVSCLERLAIAFRTAPRFPPSAPPPLARRAAARGDAASSERNLEEALLAVGQFPGRRKAALSSPSDFKIAWASPMLAVKRGRPRHQLRAAPSRSSTARPLPRWPRARKRVLIWNVRARGLSSPAHQGAVKWAFPTEEHLARIGAQHPGEQVHQRSLARAAGPMSA